MSFLYFNMLQHFHCATELCHIIVKGDYAAPLFCIGRVSLWKNKVSTSITDEQSQLQSIAYTSILQVLRGSIRDIDPPNWWVADFAVESGRIYCPFTTFLLFWNSTTPRSKQENCALRELASSSGNCGEETGMQHDGSTGGVGPEF